MLLLFLETLQPCGFTDFYGGTWIYEKRLIYYDAEFHGIYISFKLISYVFCVSDVC